MTEYHIIFIKNRGNFRIGKRYQISAPTEFTKDEKEVTFFDFREYNYFTVPISYIKKINTLDDAEYFI